MKKILALILALCMIFALAACGSEKGFNVVGTWSAPVDLVKTMAEAEPETAAMFGEDPINIEMLLIFAEDGTVKADVSLDEAIPALKAAMIPYMTKMIEEEYGMTLEDFESAMGMTLDELVDQQLDPESMKESFDNEDLNGTYVVEGDKVIVKIGSAEHPMLPEHYIQWVALQTKLGNQRKALEPGQAPEVCFKLCCDDEVEAVYAYCNLHGLWKS